MLDCTIRRCCSSSCLSSSTRWAEIRAGSPSGGSAGASSILHHLVREGGTVDPKFRAFAVQSPAFQWSWDNTPGGQMDQVSQSFSSLAGCGSTFNMTCLKGATITSIEAGNQGIFDKSWANKQFPVGPSVDGVWIKTLPALSLNSPGAAPIPFLSHLNATA